MRIRSIRPEFWTGEKVRQISPWARLLLLGLNNYCDDQGRGEWDLPIIKAQIFPTDRISIGKLLAELVRVGAIVKYQVAGKDYLAIPNWDKLQHPNRPQDSKLPAISEGSVYDPVKTTNSLNEHAPLTDAPLLDSRVGDSKVIGGESRGAAQPVTEETTFEKFWQAYPKKAAKLDAQKAWVKLKPSAELILVIRTALEAQKKTKDWLKENGAYVPHAVSWLNAERWNDEIPVDKTRALMHEIAFEGKNDDSE